MTAMFIETTPHHDAAPGKRRHMHIVEPRTHGPSSISLTTHTVDLAISTSGFNRASPVTIALTRHGDAAAPVITTKLTLTPEELDHLTDWFLALAEARVVDTNTMNTEDR